jgi:glutathione peroxidase
MDKDSIYDFVVKDSEMQDVPISSFKQKVLLVVNVASECGFTYQ